MNKDTAGKLIFSNPPHPDAGFTPVMKDLSEVPEFLKQEQASGKTFQMRQVAVYQAPPDVEVTRNNPVVISGTGPVSVEFGTVTLRAGGQIRILTAANINIARLIKKFV